MFQIWACYCHLETWYSTEDYHFCINDPSNSYHKVYLCIMYWCLLMGMTLTLRVWVGSHNSGPAVQGKCRGLVKNISPCHCVIRLYLSSFVCCSVYYSPKVKFSYSFNQLGCSRKYSYWLACKKPHLHFIPAYLYLAYVSCSSKNCWRSVFP
jgi:hypothetical protein